MRFLSFSFRWPTLVALLFLASPLAAQFSTPKYSNEFLAIGVGARGLAMSSSQTALVDDVTAGYWNPAGLLGSSFRYEGSLMHAEYFAGQAKYDYAAFSTPVDSVSRLGFSLIRFGVDDLADTRFLIDPATGAPNYNNVSFFSVADYAFLVSYARQLNFLPGLRVGANLKIIHRNAGNFGSAWGAGLDAGAQLERKGWRFGLMARDITTTLTAWSYNTALLYDTYLKTGNEIPDNNVEVTLPKLSLGVARSFQFNQKLGLLATLDINATFDGQRNEVISADPVSAAPSLGMELDYVKRVYLRGGVGNIQRLDEGVSFQPNFGVGLRLGNAFWLDYALTDIGDRSASPYSHVFSLRAGFQ